MAGIFKAYDIRGIYGKELDETVAYDIGRAFVTLTQARRVVVARDIRTHSDALFAALARGVRELGADLIDIGVASTPMCYFANGFLGAEGSVMITASHNTAEWNGFKLCRAGALPISGDTGIMEMEEIISEGSYAEQAAQPGSVTTVDILPEYRQHVAGMAQLTRPVRLAIDFANAMGIWEVQALQGLITWDGLFQEPDGRFPNHEANPLNHSTLELLQQKVRTGNYDFGVAFDGDADRAGFVDEQGGIVPMDLVTALIAEDMLSRNPGGVIFYDLRSSRVVKEVIERTGGVAMMSRVGHAFIKQQMRDNQALFAGELSGHYYFKDNYTAESSAMAVVALANIVTSSGKSLSELVAPLRKYSNSGEINSRVACDPAVILEKLRTKYQDGRQSELDGVSVYYDQWWFNVRCSNTEPLVRLNLEADTPELMEQKKTEVLALIRSE